MAKLEYVIPFLQPHITVQLPGTPAHAPVRSGQGEAENRIDVRVYKITSIID